MVGHPGETEEDFEELKEFVRKVRFDRMGAFAYSEEEGTYAAGSRITRNKSIGKCAGYA